MTAAAARRSTVLVAITAAALGACGGSSRATSPERMTITDVWARTTPAGATTGAVYLTMASADDDSLLGATVAPSVAASTQLHTTAIDATGRAEMSELDSLPIPEGDEVELAPGGAHVMLVDLAAALEAGDAFELTLEFERAGIRVLDAEVRDDAP